MDADGWEIRHDMPWWRAGGAWSAVMSGSMDRHVLATVSFCGTHWTARVCRYPSGEELERTEHPDPDAALARAALLPERINVEPASPGWPAEGRALSATLETLAIGEAPPARLWGLCLPRVMDARAFPDRGHVFSGDCLREMAREARAGGISLPGDWRYLLVGACSPEPREMDELGRMAAGGGTQRLKDVLRAALPAFLDPLAPLLDENDRAALWREGHPEQGWQWEDDPSDHDGRQGMLGWLWGKLKR
jgi:hypothetical protein